MSRPTDAAAFERLRTRLTALSRRIVGSTADAEDVVQDCFFKWHQADLSTLATPAAWLTTVVQRQSIDRRARRRLRAHEDKALPEEKLCRALVLRFQAALHGHDVAELVTLLADEQPMSVHVAPPAHNRAGANDASYLLAA